MSVNPVSIDFETYSEAGYVWDIASQKWEALPGASQGKKGLRVVGTSVYSEHPSTEVLTLSFGGGNWQPGKLPPVALFAHIRRGGLVKAWNTRFEYLIWNNVCVPKYGWPPLPLNQLRDTMAASRAHALPGALGKAAEVLGLAEQKNPDGDRLIKKFSVPRNPTKKDPRTRILLSEDTTDGPLMIAYCDQDVRAEMAAGEVIPDLSAAELEVWLLDQEINDRGVMLDMDGVQSCIAVIEQAHAQYNKELHALTGGTVSRASELQKLIGWLGAQGVHTSSLDEEHLTELLRLPELSPQTRRALEIRAAIGSAAVKKVFAMRNAVSGDGRLRDLYLYHGARTGRCIAEGQGVLVRDEDGRIFETPIEDVRVSQLLWDGAGWVSHRGVVPQGVQEVITHDGVTATPDHLVFTSTDEYAKLSELAEKQIPIFRGEVPCPFTFTGSRKKRHAISSRERAKTQWANRTDAERSSVSDRISKSVKALHDDPGYREKFLLAAAKGRANMDRGVQGAAASKGLKKFWAELKEDPEKYAAHIDARKATLKTTLKAKGFKCKK